MNLKYQNLLACGCTKKSFNNTDAVNVNDQAMYM